MHRPTVYLIACSVLAGSAMAQTRTAALLSPVTQAEASFRDIQEPIAAREGEKPQQRARTSRFDHRDMERRNRSLMGSVCADCTTAPKREPGTIRPDAEAVELPIADPATAPDQ